MKLESAKKLTAMLNFNTIGCQVGEDSLKVRMMIAEKKRDEEMAREKEKQKFAPIKEIDQNNFENELIEVKFKDYYFSNVIARSSKTMLECNNSKINFKKTGTEG